MTHEFKPGESLVSCCRDKVLSPQPNLLEKTGMSHEENLTVNAPCPYFMAAATRSLIEFNRESNSFVTVLVHKLHEV